MYVWENLTISGSDTFSNFVSPIQEKPETGTQGNIINEF